MDRLGYLGAEPKPPPGSEALREKVVEQSKERLPTASIHRRLTRCKSWALSAYRVSILYRRLGKSVAVKDSP